MPKGPSCRGCGLPLADSDLRAGRTSLHVRCSPTRRTDPGGKDAPPPAPVFRPPAPGTDLGQLLVLRDLGQGGMGTVVAARDLSLDRDVAVKFLNQGRPGDSKFLARVRREGRALARVEHPHVVRVYSVAAWEGWPFLVMEMVRGTPLSDVLSRGTLPVDEALRLAEELAEALAAVHSQGITHRDVKPQNCILRQGGGSLCLIDFGLARGAETSMRSSSGAGGTIHYMAPEQLRNRKVDARADVYGFGVTLFECLTGRRTHDGDEPAILFQAILNEDAPLLRTVRPGAPRGLEVLLARALARSPEFRQADGRALVDQVRALRAGGGSGAAAAPEVAAPSVRAPPHDPAETYPLLGRGAEYRASLEALDAASGGRGSLLLVEGGAGAGKTRFLREVERAARARGMEILRCECAEFAGAPHRAVRSMLVAAAAARGAVGPEAVVAPIRADDTAGDLLAPALRWFFDSSAAETGQGPARSLLVRAVQALLRSFLSGRPALLVADDLHLLDEGSLDLLADVLEDSPSWPLAVAASFRPAEGARQGAALAGRLPRLEGLRGARRLVLGPLSAAAVATMAYRGLGMSEDEACRLAPALHKRSAGNPLFVVECLRMLEQEQAADHRVASVPASRRLTRLAIPPRLLELALHRVSHLPREEREALGAVSVEPAGLTAAVVARCLDLPPRAALRVLQELAQARGLLQPSGERYSIANAAIREAAYGNLLPELRRAYHDEAAKALQAAGADAADPSALGRHLRLAGRGADAVAPLVEAGRRLLRCGSVAEAMERFDEALQCAGTAGSAAASLGRAEALARSGDAEGARAVLRAVAEGKEGRVEALLRLALLERDRGEYEEALAMLDRAESLPGSADERLRLAVYRAQVLSRLLRFEQALAVLDGAAELAPSAGQDSRIRLAFTRGTVLWRVRRFEEAREQWQAMLPLVEEGGDLEMATLLLHNLSLVCADLARLPESLAWAVRALERARLMGSGQPLAYSLLQVADLHLRLKRLVEAEAAVTEAESILDRMEASALHSTVMTYRCRLALARNDAAQALDRARKAVGSQRAESPDWAELRLLEARALLLLGRNDEALTAARAARPVMHSAGKREEVEEADALAARALRTAGVEGDERARIRALTQARTTLGALESAKESADPGDRTRKLEEARRLVRNELDRAALDQCGDGPPGGILTA